MTDLEFKEQMKRLVLCFPKEYDSKPRIELIFERVKEFDQNWLRKIVDRIILSNKPDFDFDGAIRGQKLSNLNAQLTLDVIKASDFVGQNISENGLKTALDGFGAATLVEALRSPAKRSSTAPAKYYESDFQQTRKGGQ